MMIMIVLEVEHSDLEKKYSETTEQSAVILNNVNIDQANAAAESNGRFFNKMNRFKSIRIANQNALIGRLLLLLLLCNWVINV